MQVVKMTEFATWNENTFTTSLNYCQK